ncbi:hypothetical protein HYFRA_00012235 [Hymenoscyphus fraxineus]|uniref:Helix-turn-helix domain-containing protein n=1 Tax=Hymenoscyphus fraxineus TaxID=746836 RepID=A0A9N9PRA5_9HELO|nr:hypothetical protein HYFRA_00012235 [Hymenoscyphus fraxineus]
MVKDIQYPIEAQPQPNFPAPQYKHAPSHLAPAHQVQNTQQPNAQPQPQYQVLRHFIILPAAMGKSTNLEHQNKISPQTPGIEGESSQKKRKTKIIIDIIASFEAPLIPPPPKTPQSRLAMGSSSSKVASSTARTVSQAASTSKNTAARKYPTRIPETPSSTGPRIQTPKVAVEHEAHDKETPGITQTLSQSASLNARLQSLGPVTPNPTFSPSSTFSNAPVLRHSHQSPTQNSTQNSPPPNFTPSSSSPGQSIFPSAAQNPAVSLLTARYRLAEEAEREFEGLGKKGSQGKRFLDVVIIRQILMLRAKGMRDEGIEEVLELRRGVVKMLGGKGVFGAAD